MKKKDECIFERDKISGHLFCNGCGNNYLLHKHKEDCPHKEEDGE